MTNIEFEKIPNSLRKPGVYTEYNAKGAVTTLPTNEQEVLIVAPMIGGATAFTQPVRVYSDLDAAVSTHSRPKAAAGFRSRGDCYG